MIKKNSKSTSSNILLLDDHPFVTNLFEGLIKNYNQEIDFNFTVAKNCEEAVIYLENLKQNATKVALAVIDISLPAFKEIKSGADIAVLIKKDFPDCKIIVVTAFTDPLTIYNLLQKTTIEAVLCKSDIDHNEIIIAYEKVLKGETFRTKTVLEEMTIIAQNKFNLDSFDFEILQRLHEGKKTVDLTNYIDLSLSAIEKRKANLKRVFLKNGGTDKELIEKVKKTGLLN